MSTCHVLGTRNQIKARMEAAEYEREFLQFARKARNWVCVVRRTRESARRWARDSSGGDLELRRKGALRNRVFEYFKLVRRDVPLLRAENNEIRGWRR